MTKLEEAFNAAAPIKQTGNTVLGQPERAFCKGWVFMLARAMMMSNKGFSMESTRRKKNDRRPDKLEFGRRTKLERRLLKPAVQA